MCFEPLGGRAAHPDPQKRNRLAHLERQPLRLPRDHLLLREVGEAGDAVALRDVAGLARNHKRAALAHHLVKAQVDRVAPVWAAGGRKAPGVRPLRQATRARRASRGAGTAHGHWRTAKMSIHTRRFGSAWSASDATSWPQVAPQQWLPKESASPTHPFARTSGRSTKRQRLAKGGAERAESVIEAPQNGEGSGGERDSGVRRWEGIGRTGRKRGVQ